MSQEKQMDIQSVDFIGCLGEFNMSKIICRKYCCLSLRCIIEQNRCMQTDIMEELMASCDVLLRIQ